MSGTDRLRVRCVLCGPEAEWDVWGTMPELGGEQAHRQFEPDDPESLRCPSCLMFRVKVVELNGAPLEDAE